MRSAQDISEGENVAMEEWAGEYCWVIASIGVQEAVISRCWYQFEGERLDGDMLVLCLLLLFGSPAISFTFLYITPVYSDEMPHLATNLEFYIPQITMMTKNIWWGIFQTAQRLALSSHIDLTAALADTQTPWPFQQSQGLIRPVISRDVSFGQAAHNREPVAKPQPPPFPKIPL